MRRCPVKIFLMSIGAISLIVCFIFGMMAFSGARQNEVGNMGYTIMFIGTGIIAILGFGFAFVIQNLEDILTKITASNPLIDDAKETNQQEEREK